MQSFSAFTLTLTASFLVVIGTTGCSANFSAPVTSAVTTTHASIVGNLHGGQQGISGASIQLYAAGEPATGGTYGTGATPLITGTLPVTDLNGDFTITGDYTLPTQARHFYIVATGGSAGTGLPTNSHIALMAVLSGCTPTTALSPSLFVEINEVSTIAAVVALQPFLAAPSATNVGAPSIGAPASAYTSMQNGFEMVGNLVDLASGTALTHAQNYATTDNNALLLNSMADILASCINSLSSSGRCTSLGSAVMPTSQSFAPLDTIQTAFYIAQNPTNNVSTIFNLGGVAPPFTGLGSAPASFAMTTSNAASACQSSVALGSAAS
jgi:hypothetical protein